MGRKSTAIKRFAGLLKQTSNIPELKDFREQARDVFRLGGAEGLECWIDARRELGLLVDPAVAKAASGLQAAVASAINEALGPLPKPKPSVRHRTPPEAPVTPAPAPRRLSMLERMAAAWDRLTDKGQAA